MDLGLKGKRALVTGGSRGIGAAICKTLLADGAHVATCARGEEGLAALRTETGAGQTELFTQAFDVRDADALGAFVGDAAEAMGGLDIVISNVSTRIDQDSDALWTETFDVDLLQHVRLKQLTAEHLERSGAGSLVLLASVASSLTTLPPYEEAYGAMKAALVNLCGQWAQTSAAKNIRVNAISPGPVFFEGGWWSMIKQAQPASFDRAVGAIPLGRLGSPDEIAKAVTFLASDAASYITGANLRIDGGLIKAANF